MTYPTHHQKIKCQDLFQPGRGVFTTLRIYQGVPLFFEQHISLLRESAEALGLDGEAIPLDVSSVPWTVGGNGRWRLILDGTGFRTLYVDEEVSEPVGPYTLSLSPVRVGSQNWDARFKTLSYLTHLQAKAWASTDEVVLMNELGQMASVSMGNLFWIIQDRLYTPAQNVGCREGVIREFVLRHVARLLNKVSVKLGGYPLSDLLLADEIFVTSSIKGIVSIKNFAGKTWTEFPRADILRGEYTEELSRQIAKSLRIQ